MQLTRVGFIVVLASCYAFWAKAKETAGYVEKVWIFPGPISIDAKLDTGAKTSSLGAREVMTFRNQEQDWVRFTIEERVGRHVKMERPVVRTVSIKGHFGKQQTRPVVELDVCLGNRIKRTEINLVDRRGFDYNMLIGRSFLMGDFLVDSESKFQLQPACNSPK